eukprot:jgi/Chrzof1/14861/Cz09g18230.t1
MHGHCRGAPRHNAKAKDSEWVLQRQGLEQQKPADVNEVVLSTPEGHIMEGLTSNFFVLQGGSVVTADEGVLSGTVRELVLEVCLEQGIPVVLQPPCIHDIDHWQGAFISSTSRLMLPVDEIQYHHADGSSEVKVYAQRHPLLQRLEAAVMDHILASSEAVL